MRVKFILHEALLLYTTVKMGQSQAPQDIGFHSLLNC